MTTRLLAAALLCSAFALSACDSATTPVQAEPATALLDFYIDGPSSLQVGRCGGYVARASSGNQPVATSSWSVTGGGALNGTTSTSAQVLATSAPSFTVYATRVGGGTASKVVTVTGTSDGTTDC